MNIQQLIELETELDDRVWEVGLDIDCDQIAGLTDEDIDDRWVQWEHLWAMLTAVRIAIHAWHQDMSEATEFRWVRS